MNVIISCWTKAGFNFTESLVSAFLCHWNKLFSDVWKVFPSCLWSSPFIWSAINPGQSHTATAGRTCTPTSIPAGCTDHSSSDPAADPEWYPNSLVLNNFFLALFALFHMYEKLHLILASIFFKIWSRINDRACDCNLSCLCFSVNCMFITDSSPHLVSKKEFGHLCMYYLNVPLLFTLDGSYHVSSRTRVC